MKKLRQYYAPKKFRFYMCGEYGDEGGRPHYHALLFGLDFEDKTIHSREGEKTHYTSETLRKIWGLGHVLIGPVTQKTAAYCARYNLKKVTGERAIEHYQRVNSETGEIYWLLPEYTNMSRMPGIGKGWFDKFKSDVYPSDFMVDKGKKYQVPKYYDKQLEKENPDLHKTIKRKRIKRALKRAADNTPQRLAVREECLTAKTKTLKRKL